MSQTYTTQGIILKRWDYKERDRMIRILTREHGKITTRAISARKHGSKLAGHLEPFIYSDFFIARSRTIDIVAGSNTIQSHAQLRHSLTHSALANYFAEVVDRFTQEHHEDQHLFEHVHEFYQWLNTSNANILGLYAAIVQLLGILGYRLELYECHACKRPIEQEGSKFHYTLWNVECHECTSQDETIGLSANVIKIARFINERPFKEVVQLSVPQKEWIEFHGFIRSMLDYHIDRHIQSEAVLLALLK